MLDGVKNFPGSLLNLTMKRTYCLVLRPLSVFQLGQSVSGNVVPSPKQIDREDLKENHTGIRKRTYKPKVKFALQIQC